MNALPDLPIRRVNPLYGWKWLSVGWNMFKHNPPLWLSLMGIYFFGTLLLLAIPGIGPLLYFMALPGVLAGCLLACRDIETGSELELAHLVAGFKAAARPLVGLGAISFLISTLTIVLLVMGWKEPFGEILELMTADRLDAAALENAMVNLTTPLLVGVGVFSLFAMAMWFAPALIVFRQARPLPALVLSFKAAAVNFWPFLVYCVLLMLLDLVISLAARVVVGLIASVAGTLAGNLLFVLLAFPIVFLFFALIICGIYVSYQDIFETRASPQQGEHANG